MENSYIQGLSLIGNRRGDASDRTFYAVNPITGQSIKPTFYCASHQEAEAAGNLSCEAASSFGAMDGRSRATFLRAIAAELTANTETIIQRAHLETGLPLPRLQGEMVRTTKQLQLFAEVIEEGSWVDARIDLSEPERKPLPRSDIRSMLRPLGPVVVFGASNFPLAFSVAGGDTTSALAAGNPVIVKAHPAHPGTSELVGKLISDVVAQMGLHPGVFSLLFDEGTDIARAIVQHPAIKAVGFTGSSSAGQALTKLCNERPLPIPCYAEMGSTNPLFILPGAMEERAEIIAQEVKDSFTLGSGQFCTKPGIIFIPKDSSSNFIKIIQKTIKHLPWQGMLTPSISNNYKKSVEARSINAVEVMATTSEKWDPRSPCAVGQPIVFSASLEQFLTTHDLEDEIFGPTSLLVIYAQVQDLYKVASRLHGHLTATIHANDSDMEIALGLTRALEAKVGRILFNGYPTGVEVCHAMVHGGPFPATSDSRSTSVGTRAMLRFVRPVCYQDFPDQALPPELQQNNQLSIIRLVNGKLVRD